jgi:pimeloyl-ACP methyl ester carboxylesterase
MWRMIIAIAVLGMALSAPAAFGKAGGAEANLYLQPKRLVAIDGKRRLNLVCSGSGAPTVVFISGAGGSAADWRKVQPRLSKETRTCAYDRAGYGFSDAADRESDARNAVSDLYSLLKRASIQGPIVLVGHSVGGLYAELFAAEHTDEIAGLVLVDPSGLDDFFFIPRVLNAEEKAHENELFTTRPTELNHCVELARAGHAPGPGCASPVTGDPALDRVLKSQASTVGYWSAYRSEMLNVFPDAPLGPDSVITRQVTARPLELGDRPLILLKTPGGAPPGARGVWSRAVSLASAKRLVASSSRGKVVEVQSPHYVQLAYPDAVIEAVAEVMGKKLAAASQHAAIKLDDQTLQRLVGRYKLPSGTVVEITLTDGRLFAQFANQDRFEIFPESPTRVFWKIVDAQADFSVDASGHATMFTLHQNGSDHPALLIGQN